MIRHGIIVHNRINLKILLGSSANSDDVNSKYTEVQTNNANRYRLRISHEIVLKTADMSKLSIMISATILDMEFRLKKDRRKV